MWDFFITVLAFFEKNKEFFGFVGVIITLITTYLRQKQVKETREELKSLPIDLNTPGSVELRDHQLDALADRKRALGALIVCLIGLLPSIVVMGYFGKEMATHIQAHGPISFDGRNWGKGVVLFALWFGGYLGTAGFGLVAFYHLVLAGYYWVRFKRSK